MSETRTDEQTNSSDESEVGELYHNLLRTWNNRDAAGMAGLFEDDGISIGFDGSQYESADQIESELSRIFADHPTPPYVGKIKETRMLSKDLGLVRAIAGMVPPGKSDLDPALNTVQSLLARKTDRWRIVIYQNTPAQFHGRPDLVEEMTKELRQLV